MPPIPVRWSKVHDKALHELFASREAHPERLQNDYIDMIFTEVEDRTCFHGIDKIKFRSHYKTKAAQWLTEQSMAGRRRRESDQYCACSCFRIISTLSFCPLILSFCSSSQKQFKKVLKKNSVTRSKNNLTTAATKTAHKKQQGCHQQLVQQRKQQLSRAESLYQPKASSRVLHQPPSKRKKSPGSQFFRATHTRRAVTIATCT